MDFSIETQLNSRKSTNCEEYIIEKEVDNFDRKRVRIEKIKIQIKFTSDQKLIYAQNGAILRQVECQNNFEKPEIFQNLDQIRNLSWSGQYGKNNKKDGKWSAFWNKELLKNVGGYYKEGQKLGLWKDLSTKYCSEAQIFEIGEYQNDLRFGKWNYIQKDGKIGGGFYNKDGQKQGKWIELEEGYCGRKKVTHYGEYDMNGMKLGRWDIMYCKEIEQEYKQIGSGAYDQEGNQKKNGKWIELDEGFYSWKQVIYSGKYNKSGIKVGRWDILYCQWGEQEYNQIGGGSYDQEGNQKKVGKWIELDEMFDGLKKITYNGEYNMNNIKVDRWDIMFCSKYEKEYKQIGGGSYDQEGNQKKIGKWVELDEKFDRCKQITYNGEYNQNNMKVGRWNIMYCKWDEKEYKQIGGGSYNQEGNQKKIGKWVELDEKFNYWDQIAHKGEYNMNGLKVGRWDITYCKGGDKEYKQICGGSYDQEGNQRKVGKWVELFEGFRENAQFTYNGEYNMKGHKVGIWVEMDIRKNQRRGEKRYDN